MRCGGLISRHEGHEEQKFGAARMFSARASKKQLAALCRRLATSLEAGLDIRRVLAREAETRGYPALRSRMATIEREVARGVSLQEAVKETGDYFPPLFREMIAVGESTGKSAEVFKHLAEHYEHQMQVTRVLMMALALPVLELSFAALLIGGMIYALGVVADYNNGQAVDILGGGLVGTPGLIKYFTFLGTLGLCGFFAYQAIRRGWLWGRMVERIVLRVPLIGWALKVIATERLAWNLNLTLDTPMPTAKAVDIALRGSQNGVYQDAAPDIVRDIKSGRSIAEGFDRAKAFPDDFMEALDIGERSGRIPESMGHLARQYQDKGRLAIRAMAVAAGILTVMLIFGIMIALIFRIALFYVGTINDLAQPH